MGIALAPVSTDDVIDFDNAPLRIRPDKAEFIECKKREQQQDFRNSRQNCENRGINMMWQLPFAMIVMFMPHDDGHHLVADGRAMRNLNDPPSDASTSNGESNEKDKSPVDASEEDKLINLYITGNKDADKHDAICCQCVQIRALHEGHEHVFFFDWHGFRFICDNVDTDTNSVGASIPCRTLRFGWSPAFWQESRLQSLRAKKRAESPKPSLVLLMPSSIGKGPRVPGKCWSCRAFTSGSSSSACVIRNDEPWQGKQRCQVMKMCKYYPHGKHLVTMPSKADKSPEHEECHWPIFQAQKWTAHSNKAGGLPAWHDADNRSSSWGVPKSKLAAGCFLRV